MRDWIVVRIAWCIGMALYLASCVSPALRRRLIEWCEEDA